MNRMPLPTIREDSRSFEDYMEREKLVTSSDATGAAYDLAWRDTIFGLYGRSAQISEFEATGATKLTRQEANDMYPDLPEPFTEDVNPYVAALKYSNFKEKQELEYKMSMGPEDSWTQTKMFGAGLVAHLLDPAEFGAGALVGWAVGGAALTGGLGATAERIAVQASAKGASLPSRLAFDAIEGGGGALIENTAQEMIQKRVEAREGIVDERSFGDIATDVLIGSVAAFGMQAIPKSIARGVELHAEGVRRNLRDTAPEADLPVARHYAASAQNGTRPNITPLMNVIAKETDVVEFNNVKYTHTPLVKSADGRIKTDESFFISRGELTPNAPIKHVGDDYGFGGTHVTNNPGVANAASARSMSDSIGAVEEVRLSELRPLFLDEVPSPELKTAFAKFVDESGFNLKDVPDASTKEYLEIFKDMVDAGAVPEAKLLELAQTIKDMGFDSLYSNGKSRLGVEHSAHNHIILLDDTKFQKVGEFKADRNQIRKPNEAELAEARKQVESPDRFLGEKDFYQKKMQELTESNLEQANSDFRKNVESDLEFLEDLNKQGLLEDPKIIDEIKQNLAEAEEGFTILKAYKACLMKG